MCANIRIVLQYCGDWYHLTGSSPSERSVLLTTPYSLEKKLYTMPPTTTQDMKYGRKTMDWESFLTELIRSSFNRIASPI